MPDPDEPKNTEDNSPEINDSISPLESNNKDTEADSSETPAEGQAESTDLADGSTEDVPKDSFSDQSESSEEEETSSESGASDVDSNLGHDSSENEAHEIDSAPEKHFDVSAAEGEEAVAVDMPKSQDNEDGGAAVFSQANSPIDHTNDVEWPPKQSESVEKAGTPTPEVASFLASNNENTASVAPPEAGTGYASPVMADHQKGGGKKLWLGGLLVLIIVLLICGYAFGVYLPNKPSAMYQSGLENSAKAADRLIDYAQQEDTAGYESAKFSGQVNYSGAFAADINFTGQADKKSNSDVKLNGDIMGEKVGVNIKTIQAKNTLSPDLYFQVNNVKKLLDQNGMNALDSLDGQWLKVDHTLIDYFSPQALGAQGGFQKADLPTTSELNDAMSKIESVNKDYLFTTDSTKAVLTNPDFIGKDTVDGHTQYHYKVSYDKAHLQAYIDAEQKALDSSSLNTWSKKVNQGKNLSDAMDFKSLKKSVASAPSDYKFDLWVNKDTRLVSKVQFVDPKHDYNQFTLSQNYVGGDNYPLSFDYTGKDDNGKPNNGQLDLNINSSTHKINLKVNIDAYDNGAPVKTKLTLDVTPNKNLIKVVAPSGAESINDLLGELGLGGTAQATQKSSQKTEVQSTLASAQTQLEVYRADNGGSYPASKSVFLSWLKSSTGGHDASLAKTIQSSSYQYSSTPKVCGGSHQTCSGYSLSASASTYGGKTPITVSDGRSVSA